MAVMFNVVCLKKLWNIIICGQCKC